MTPRSGLYVAFVGLIMAGLCFSILGLLAVFEKSLPPSDNLTAIVGIVLLDLGLGLGVIVMVVGLVTAGIRALTKQTGKPS